MKSHDNDNQGESVFTCRECDFQSVNREQLIEHIKRKHNKHICNSCNISCNSKSDLSSHILKTHKSEHKPCRNFASNKCDYNEECRYKHIKLKENEHICFTCGFIASSIKNLMQHIMEIHGSQPCRKFAERKCDRGQLCWFSHDKISKTAPTQEVDFQEIPTTRRQMSSVVGAQDSQLHQMSTEAQNQKIFLATQRVITQMMPTLVKQIMDSIVH